MGRIQPIQRLPRTAYFVPTLFHTGRLLKNLYADGGLACETYARTRGNPGDLVAGEVIARILANPEVDVQLALSEVLQKLYKPINKVALDELIKIYSVAEDAFFSNYRKKDKNFNFKDIILLVPRDGTGIENSYLHNMDSSSRMNYKKVIEALTICVSDLKNKVQNKKELKKLGQCFEQVLTQF